MQIILLHDVDKLGLRGEVVDVARGYARNYLLPRRLAETATPAKVRELERREAKRARHEARSSEQAQEVATKLGQIELRFDVKAGPTGVLFGSVTPTDIADEIWTTAKVRVDRRKIDLPDSIKRVGRYTIPIAIFEDVTAEVRTLVIPEGGELPPEEALAAMEAAAAAEEQAAAAAEAEAEAAHAIAEAELEEALAEDDAADDEATPETDAALPEPEAVGIEADAPAEDAPPTGDAPPADDAPPSDEPTA
jgi:large subunit ribosomal protein L9